MRPAVHGVHAVGERVNHLVEAVVVLQRRLHDSAVLDALLDVDGLLVQRLARLVQVADEAADAAVEVVRHFVVRPAVGVVEAAEAYLKPLVEIRHLLEALREGVEVVFEVVEDLLVGQEGHRRAVRAALGVFGVSVAQVALADAARELLIVDAASAPDFDQQPLREGVDDGRAHAVQPAGDGVRLAAELAAGVQGGHDGLDAGQPGGGMLVDGDAASVVDDANGAVFVQRDLDGGAEPRHELVHGVVDDFDDEMMQPALVGAADVHARTPPDGLHAFEHLNIGGGVLVVEPFCR